MPIQDTRSGKLHQAPKFAFIDAVRGYAALLVMTAHTGGMFPLLPYPLKKLTNFGVYGVQLFFLASCVTLLFSWYSDERRGTVSLSGFWLRRFFRVAPMFYLAMPFYYFTEPPASGFDAVQLISAVTFVNIWHPALLPIDPGRWTLVPGGWSVGVEFSFYAVFPLVALLVRSLEKAVLFFICALLFGSIANPSFIHLLGGPNNHAAVKEFVYYWFPNQLPVFALGAVLYFMLERYKAFPESRVISLVREHGMLSLSLCLAACVVIANIAMPDVLPIQLPFVLPKLLFATMVFMAVVLVLAHAAPGPLVNKAVQNVGRVSFSAYILHFSVLHQLTTHMPGIFDIHATGWGAIAVFVSLWVTTIAVTVLLANVTFTIVERPMIQLGRLIIARRSRPQNLQTSAP